MIILLQFKNNNLLRLGTKSQHQSNSIVIYLYQPALHFTLIDVYSTLKYKLIVCI
jgi:hypothetical protein